MKKVVAYIQETTVIHSPAHCDVNRLNWKSFNIKTDKIHILLQTSTKTRIWCGNKACGRPPSPATLLLATWKLEVCWRWLELRRPWQAPEVRDGFHSVHGVHRVSLICLCNEPEAASCFTDQLELKHLDQVEAGGGRMRSIFSFRAAEGPEVLWQKLFLVFNENALFWALH